MILNILDYVSAPCCTKGFNLILVGADGDSNCRYARSAFAHPSWPLERLISLLLAKYADTPPTHGFDPGSIHQTWGLNIAVQFIFTILSRSESVIEKSDKDHTVYVSTLHD